MCTARTVKCRGVSLGFQYFNFYGTWQLDAALPQCNERPHYIHNTMYGGQAHLFHCIDPHYHVPRWVLGPAPGNENGWAFCESDAPTPNEVRSIWISWDGEAWHSCPSLRFEALPPGTMPGTAGEFGEDESDYEEEAALERLFVRDDGEAADGTAARGGSALGALPVGGAADDDAPPSGVAQPSAAASTGAAAGAEGAPRAAEPEGGAVALESLRRSAAERGREADVVVMRSNGAGAGMKQKSSFCAIA